MRVSGKSSTALGPQLPVLHCSQPHGVSQRKRSCRAGMEVEVISGPWEELHLHMDESVQGEPFRALSQL